MTFHKHLESCSFSSGRDSLFSQVKHSSLWPSWFFKKLFGSAHGDVLAADLLYAKSSIFPEPAELY